MLLSSPRITAADHRVWDRLEHHDSVLARSPRLLRLEAKAMDVIRQFILEPCYVGVSWGKDSVVVAHLAWRVMKECGTWRQMVWTRDEPHVNPDCAAVRDAFFEMCPVTDQYLEIEVPHRWSKEHQQWVCCPYPGISDSVVQRNMVGIELTRMRTGTRRWVSGIRAEESGERHLRMRAHGTASKNTSAPIGWWKGLDVFAYLRKYDLPVHPAYAMSFGGVLDRNRLRVAPIGSERGRRFGRLEWEERYYNDVLRQRPGWNEGWK